MNELACGVAGAGESLRRLPCAVVYPCVLIKVATSARQVRSFYSSIDSVVVGEMVHLNIHFPSPKPKLDLEEVERRFRSASLPTGENR